MIARSKSRKRAYHYSLEKTSPNANYISLDVLVSLRKGPAGLSPKLVSTLKTLLRPVANESVTDDYLVRPFQSET